MMTQLVEDNCITIHLLSYDRLTEVTERFYFLEMSTLQATTLLPHDKKIVSTKISAYTDDNKYLEENTTDNFETIGKFNNFFLNNPGYYIHDCNIVLENGINICSHDDGEISIQFQSDNSGQIFIDTIFEKYNLDKKLISILRNKPGHYFAIDKQSNVAGEYKNFDDYLKNGRSSKE